MSAKKKERKFPKPAKPYSLKAIVKKTRQDPEYGRYLHRLLVKSRKGDQAAAKILVAHFKPKSTELKNIGLRPSHFKKIPGCPMTTQRVMLAFAAHL